MDCGGKRRFPSYFSFAGLLPSVLWSVDRGPFRPHPSDLGHHPTLGTGGDVAGGVYAGPVTEAMVRRPADFIVIADVRAQLNAALISFDANLDPTDKSSGHSQWPSNRHAGRIDFLFADGHIDTGKRPDVVNPSNSLWRRRFNNDNKAHDGLDGDAVASWTYDAAAAAAIDQGF